MSGTSTPPPPPPPPPENCEDLKQHSTLTGPEPENVESLSIGELLEIKLITKGNREILVVEDEDGNEIGTLTHSGRENLIECINKGYIYVAEIWNIDGGSVDVNIRCK